MTVRRVDDFMISASTEVDPYAREFTSQDDVQKCVGAMKGAEIQVGCVWPRDLHVLGQVHGTSLPFRLLADSARCHSIFAPLCFRYFHDFDIYTILNSSTVYRMIEPSI